MAGEIAHGNDPAQAGGSTGNQQAGVPAAIAAAEQEQIQFSPVNQAELASLVGPLPDLSLTAASSNSSGITAVWGSGGGTGYSSEAMATSQAKFPTIIDTINGYNQYISGSEGFEASHNGLLPANFLTDTANYASYAAGLGASYSVTSLMADGLLVPNYSPDASVSGSDVMGYVGAAHDLIISAAERQPGTQGLGLLALKGLGQGLAITGAGFDAYDQVQNGKAVDSAIVNSGGKYAVYTTISLIAAPETFGGSLILGAGLIALDKTLGPAIGSAAEGAYLALKTHF